MKYLTITSFIILLISLFIGCGENQTNPIEPKKPESIYITFVNKSGNVELYHNGFYYDSLYVLTNVKDDSLLFNCIDPEFPVNNYEFRHGEIPNISCVLIRWIYGSPTGLHNNFFIHVWNKDSTASATLQMWFMQTPS